MDLTILEKINICKQRFKKLGVPDEFYGGMPICYGTDVIVDGLIRDLEEIRIDLNNERKEAEDTMPHKKYSGDGTNGD
jgi:hypothetical protein